ncbi:unnamed protein product [Darwinula stevensoni]|uniref:ABC transporter domain-containing protein n=1 Tax=Darwinula stevensoni TaxID=69355 RepID=A0A7R9A9G6_9CRUS|nr:unnamed protein product [Darwinula stevensoni]CAG0897380.1 unnamed protein product [Darwinula stevensoni]
MAGIAKKFLLLIWKNLLLRKRHPVLTVFEFLIPILLFASIFWMKTQLLPSGSEGDMSPPAIFKPESESDLLSAFYNRTRSVILLAPNKSSLHKDIVESLRNTWGSDRIRDFLTEEDLLTFVEVNEFQDPDRRVDIAGAVVFVGTDEKNFRYKIRIEKFSPITSFLFDPAPIPGFLEHDDMYRGSFIPLQLLVNSAWIRVMNNDHNENEPLFKDFMVKVRRMPYPEHEKNYAGLVSFIFGIMIPMFTVFGYLFIIPVQHLSVVREKQSGIKELMKMMGMPRSLYWLTHFVNGGFSVILISFIGTMFLSVGGVLSQSDGSLVFLLLLLYGFAFLGFCYLITTFFQRLLLTIPLAMILMLVSYMAPTFSMGLWTSSEESQTTVTPASAVALSLLPNMALVFGIRIISFLEGRGDGVTWQNLYDRPFVADKMSMGFVLFILLIDTVLYLLLTGYMDTVRPGKYGLAEPLYFFLKPSFWCPTKKSKSDMEELERRRSSRRKSRFFEEDPRNRKAGIEITNLRKVFQTNKGPKVAVDDLSLSACEGDITVLLGHNGAGKTTTMSIITGMYSTTGGTAFVNGYDIRHSMDKVRDSLGLCPQHSMLFPELTVREHILLFGQLKGLTRKESMEFGQRYAALMMLPLDLQSRGLSGGMKRKLSLIIALIGKTKDEKRNRTILLTTHFMEEADVLGDRIAIMAHGQLQCVGSSMFLKRQYGTGYTLTVTKTLNFAEAELLSLLQKSCPEATLKSSAGSEASFMLPSSSVGAFPSILGALDSAKTEFGIRSFGISATTLEEVFLRVGEGADAEEVDLKNRASANITNTPHASTSMLMGMEGKKSNASLLLLQFWALLIKKFLYLSRKWKLLISQAIIPLALVVGALYLDQASTVGAQQPFELKMNVDVYGKNYVPYENWSSLHGKLMDHFLSGLPDSSTPENSSEENFDGYLLGIGKEDESKYRVRYVIGGSLTEEGVNTNFTAYYQTIPYHSSGIAVNHMSDALAKYYLGSDHSILASNQPLPMSKLAKVIDSFTQPGMLSNFGSSFSYANCMGLGLFLLACSFVVFPTEENGSAAKQLQLMTGVRPGLYWLSHLVGDGVVFLIVSAIIIGILGAINTNGIFANNYGCLGSLFCLLLAYGFAALPFAYVFSFRFKSSGTAFAIHALVNIFFGILFLPVIVLFEASGDQELMDVSEILKWFVGLFPPFGIEYGIFSLIDLAYKNQRCELIDADVKEMVCSGNVTGDSAAIGICCDDCVSRGGCFEPETYIRWDGVNIGQPLTMLSYAGVFWLVFLVLLEKRYLQRFWARLFSYKATNPYENVQVDEDVFREEERITDLLRRGESDKDALLAVGLRKTFKTFVAVDHMNIGVHHGECFGLLGVNGAGKTTTFKMMTGAELMTSGASYILGYDLEKQRSKYLFHVGYCPQFDALVDLMTGKETLLMYARLRGIPKSVMGTHVNTLIDKLGLTEYKDKYCGTYSGGNKRKLSTAIAMVGEPTLLFLDEPTSGVDPVSRRNIWQALIDCTNNGQSIVLTSHSMEECESLCHRLGIMVNGRFRCLGNPQYLKDKFCQGYSIKVKTKMSASEEDIATLEAFITQTIPGSSLQDKYLGLLNFRVPRGDVTWAQLFSTVSEMKTRFEKLIEDSLVGETSLEQVFLSFTSEQIQPRPKAKCRLCPCTRSKSR